MSRINNTASQRSAFAALLAVSSIGLVSACGASPATDATLTSENQALCACTSPIIDSSRSLLVTDATALAPFSLKNVLDQLRASASANNQSSLQLYQQ